MTSVQFLTVDAKDDDVRLDRWFARHYPMLKNGQLQRLLRGKNIRVNGKKATTSQHLFAGDKLRIPPLEMTPKNNSPRELTASDTAFMKSLVLYKDADVLVLNKPSGLAVQGGSKTERHIDGLLDALRFDKEEKPKLVHRLDKDTSGILVIARTAKAAAELTAAFASREAHKIYWAVVAGKPKLKSGKIDAPLIKKSGEKGGEQMKIDYEQGQWATTLYRTLDSLSNKASWLEMSPLSGRTHQLRVHAAGALNTPIVGDKKYGDERALHLGVEDNQKLHLHARAIRMPHPTKGILEVFAPLPPHMKRTFEQLGFDEKQSVRPFDYFIKE